MRSKRHSTRSNSLTARAALFFCGLYAAGLGASPPRAEQTLVGDLNRIFHAPAMAQGIWGVEVKSVDSGRVLYALNPKTLMMPASNMKILTLAAAAATLGWDFRFKTDLDTTAPVADGALEGDLIVTGGGDPTINSRDNRAAAVLDEWAAALKNAGITRIDGNIVGDGSAFEATGLGQGWSWDYLQYGYAAPCSAMEFNENTATLTVTPGPAPGAQAALDLPPDTGLGLIYHVTTGEPGSATSIAFERTPNDHWIDVTGTIAADAKPVTRDVAVSNPPLYFARMVLNGLLARGIAIRGLPVDRMNQSALIPAPRRTLVESRSPPLRDIAATMMKVSQNLYAETLLKEVGAVNSGGVGSAEAGRSAARDLFAAWNIQPGTYAQADGSGLSRYDLVSADMLVAILERMFKDPRHHDAFTAALPIAGRDGTTASRLKDTRAEGNALTKTGSISNVRTLSGYVRTRDGETLAFSMLANAFTIPPATVNWIADIAVETLANYTSR
jgi:serine-type D-Ala-D-Ala carboxypeptidase/endopeptidase (penicillin-binding protein 4)